MKINKGNPDLSTLFQARANPWAPKYEPQMWNDRSLGQFDAAITRHRDTLECAARALRYEMLSPHIARMLSEYTDSMVSKLACTTQQEARTMRQDLMVFLNSTVLSTNCYAYALNIREGFAPGSKLTPGYLAEMGKRATVPLNGNLSLLFDGLAEDGISFFAGDPNRDQPPAGYYLTALLVRDHPITGMMEDFHFVRYDRDGSCSHKTGHGYVTNLDHAGRVITDPVTQEVHPNYKYQGCVLIPSVLPQHKFS